MAHFTISPATGTGETLVTVTPSGTNLTYEDKVSTITVTDGISTKTVTVTHGSLPHTVPSLLTVNATSGAQDINFTVDSDFNIQFSGWTAAGAFASIWDYDSGEQVTTSDNYYPEDLVGKTFSLRIQGNTLFQSRSCTLYMRHYYNNAGEWELAPYVYQISITQAAAAPTTGLSIYYLVQSDLVGEERDPQSDVILYLLGQQGELLDIVNLSLIGQDSATGYIGNSALSLNQVFQAQIYIDGGEEPVYVEMGYDDTFGSSTQMVIGDDLTQQYTVVRDAILEINIWNGES